MKFLSALILASSLAPVCFAQSDLPTKPAAPLAKIESANQKIAGSEASHASEHRTTALTAAERTSKAKKGVVYLPLVSLSSYFPIAAQILLAILVVALSGVFGAWLMFRLLARKVATVYQEAPQESAALQTNTQKTEGVTDAKSENTVAASSTASSVAPSAHGALLLPDQKQFLASFSDQALVQAFHESLGLRRFSCLLLLLPPERGAAVIGGFDHNTAQKIMASVLRESSNMTYDTVSEVVDGLKKQLNSRTSEHVSKEVATAVSGLLQALPEELKASVSTEATRLGIVPMTVAENSEPRQLATQTGQEKRRKKRQLFVTKTAEPAAVQAANVPGELAPTAPKGRGNLNRLIISKKEREEAQSEKKPTKPVPKAFLINDWFPM